MIRPLTCLSLIAALGSGMYLYGEKHRAQVLDRDITRTVRQTEQARDRIVLLRAEWALLNESERLSGLATAHLQLQQLQPAQYARLEDLKARLPAIALPPVEPATMDEPPVATAAPSPRGPVQLAAVTPAAVTPAPALPAPALPAPALPSPALAPLALPRVAATVPPHPLPARPAAPHIQPAKPAEPASKPVELASREAPVPRYGPTYAPVLPAYVPQPVVIHPPTVQTASAVALPQPAPFVGSALGMARTTLAAPPAYANTGYASPSYPSSSYPSSGYAAR